MITEAPVQAIERASPQRHRKGGRSTFAGNLHRDMRKGLSALSRKRTIETQPPNVVPQAGILFVCIDFGVAIQRGGTGRRRTRRTRIQTR